MMKKVIIHMIFALLCSVLWTQQISAQTSSRSSREEYIEKYAPLAVDHQQRYGIPASVTLAQALLESNDGMSRLATQANNHFGIKCKSDWMGGKIYHDDDEKGECFRSYKSIEESFEDHSQFLIRNARYASLFELDPYDYKAWAQGLKAAGYATSPTYAPALIKIIEDYELYKYDTNQQPDYALNHTSRKPLSRRSSTEYYEHVGGIDIDNHTVALNSVGGRGLRTNNGSRYVVARSGDSFERIASDSGVSAKRLRKYNEMAPNGKVNEGEIVYLEKKLKTYAGEAVRHEVRKGESMRDISQRYGIDLSSLKKMNKSLSRANELYEGEEINLM